MVGNGVPGVPGVLYVGYDFCLPNIIPLKLAGFAVR